MAPAVAKAGDCWLECSAHSLACSLVPSLTPLLGKIQLELLGSLVLVGIWQGVTAC